MIPLSFWHNFLVFLIFFIYLFDIFNLCSHTFPRKEDKKIVSMREHWSYCFIIFKKIICNQNVIEVEENWYITDQVILELGTTWRGKIVIVIFGLLYHYEIPNTEVNGLLLVILVTAAHVLGVLTEKIKEKQWKPRKIASFFREQFIGNC